MKAVMREGGVAVRVVGTRMPAVAALLLGLAALPPNRLTALSAQPSRLWSPGDRILFTDFSRVVSVAATPAVVYVATAGALATYDRGFLSLRETVGPLDGYEPRSVRAIVADPGDDTVWMAGAGRWLRYEPLGRRIEAGHLPGASDLVVLDAQDPSRGAYFRVGTQWFLVRRGADAVPATDVPPPARRIGPLGEAELLRRVPAFEVARARITRDQLFRSWRITSAAAPPLGAEVYVGTDGNGAFRVDATTAEVRALSSGLLGTRATAVALVRGQVCAGTSASPAAARHGVTCAGEDLHDPLHLERISPLAPLPGLIVSSLLLTERAVWVGTDRGAVRFDRRDERQVVVLDDRALPSDRVAAIAATSEGVWVGTDRGLALLADSGRAARAVRAVATPPVLALAALDDTLWIGTSSGLLVLPPLAEQAFAPPDGSAVAGAAVVALAVRGREVLVAGYSHLTVRILEGWRRLPPPIQVGRVTAAAADADGFWIAGTAGLLFLDPRSGAQHALTSPEDVPLPVNGVAASRSHVWLATDAGLVRLARAAVVP